MMGSLHPANFKKRSPQEGRSKKTLHHLGRRRKKVHTSSVADEDVKLDEESALDKVTDPLILALSSDSEPSPDGSSKAKERRLHTQKNEEDMDVTYGGNTDISITKKVRKEKSPKKKLKLEDGTNELDKKGENEDLEVAEEDATEKPIAPRVSTSSLSLVLAEKVQRSKALVECEGDSIDLSGDMGSVGRVIVQDNPAGNSDVYFDLKGTIYKTSIVPSRTFCVVSFGQSEGKIEAIMNDFIKLTPQSNVYEAETMVEGTLDGFSFDSEDETEKVPKNTNQQNQNEGLEEQPNGGKAKGKADKSSGVAKKKNKNAGGKSHPVKRGAKKTQGPKRAKAKK
ncbi:DNA-binding protein BIN4 [Linum perenne]